VSVSAPSKVILHGEHAVVYGKTAVAASLGLRTSMTIKPQLGKQVVVDFPDLGLHDSWPLERLQELFLPCPPDSSEVCPAYLARLHEFLGTDPSNLRMAGVLCFLYLYTVILHPDPVPMEIRVSSEIPLGAGLGSSAALSVCLAAGLTAVVRQVCLITITNIIIITLSMARCGGRRVGRMRRRCVAWPCCQRRYSTATLQE